MTLNMASLMYLYNSLITLERRDSFMELNNTELLSLLEGDNIETSEVLDQVEKMKKIQKVKNKYKDKVKTRKDGRQVYVYVDRKQITAKDENELYKKLYLLEFGEETYSMKDLFPIWIKWKRDYTPVSVRTLRIYSEKWKKYFEPYEIIDIPIVKLKAKDFVNLFRLWTCKRQMTSRLFCNLKSIINGIYAYAITELETVHANPIKSIDMRQFPMKPVNNDGDVFTIEERRKLLEYLSDIDEIYALAIQFDFQVLMRFAELAALQWNHVKENRIYIDSQYLLTMEMDEDMNFHNKECENFDHVKGNTDQGFRYIDLTSEAQAILAKVKALNPEGKYIFMNKGKQLSISTFNDKLKRYCREAGVPERSSHKIRFCTASILYQNGVPLAELQRMLGHTTTAMTLHYIRSVMSDERSRQIMEKALA